MALTVSQLQYIANGDFHELANFMLKLCVLPSSFAEVERVFSQVRINKTDQRNRLHVSTVFALLSIKSCSKFHDEFPDSGTLTYKSTNLYETSPSTND